jgi:acyl-CoA-binding protein
MWEFKDHWKWWAWNQQKGMPKEEARKKFLEIAIPVLKSKGIPTENEEKVS